MEIDLILPDGSWNLENPDLFLTGGIWRRLICGKLVTVHLQKKDYSLIRQRMSGAIKSWSNVSYTTKCSTCVNMRRLHPGMRDVEHCIGCQQFLKSSMVINTPKARYVIFEEYLMVAVATEVGFVGNPILIQKLERELNVNMCLRDRWKNIPSNTIGKLAECVFCRRSDWIINCSKFDTSVICGGCRDICRQFSDHMYYAYWCLINGLNGDFASLGGDICGVIIGLL